MDIDISNPYSYISLYKYLCPVLQSNPERKCVLQSGKDIVYAGKIGEIPSRYMTWEFEEVKRTDAYLLIFVKDNSELLIGYNNYERRF